MKEQVCRTSTVTRKHRVWLSCSSMLLIVLQVEKTLHITRHISPILSKYQVSYPSIRSNSKSPCTLFTNKPCLTKPTKIVLLPRSIVKFNCNTVRFSCSSMLFKGPKSWNDAKIWMGTSYVQTYGDWSFIGPIAGSYRPPGTGLSTRSSKMGFVIFTTLCFLTSSSVRKLNLTASTLSDTPCN